MGDRLATKDMGRKLRLVPLFGEMNSHLTQCRLGRIYLRTKWHLNPSSCLATTDTGQKLGSVPLLGREELRFHLTQYSRGRGLPSCQVSS